MATDAASLNKEENLKKNTNSSSFHIPQVQ